ncbi:unnamed protein product [Amoebophrya sp. A25]|nr:unnamed protein product [Amoebophrya sp. A25]|eukprot:GSA25T00010647001.1
MYDSSHPMNLTGITPARDRKSQAGVSRFACIQDSDFVFPLRNEPRHGGLCSCGPTNNIA